VEDASLRTWPVENVCEPLPTTSSPKAERDLGDGTYLYRRPDGSRFRGTRNTCRCLAPGSRIATPDGPRAVEEVTAGALIWTLDQAGRRRAVPVLKVQRAALPSDHVFLRLTLADGRVLRASPGHPLADGRALARVRVGELVDGARLVEVKRLPAGVPFSYDLLPAGGTGIYFVDGIALRSTLAP
jgi:hypothetical protein